MIRAWLRRLRPAPEPPQNVRVHLRNGATVPVELRYKGRDEDGLHVWTQVSPPSFAGSEFLGFEFDTLPGKTNVNILVDPSR